MLFRAITAPVAAAITLAAPIQSAYWELRARPHQRKAIQHLANAVADPHNPHWLTESERHLRTCQKLRQRAWLYRTMNGASR